MAVWGTEILLFIRLFENCDCLLDIDGYYQCMRDGVIFAPIREMYEKRMIYKNHPDKKPLAETLKIKMNSCYGRFGMKAYEVSKYIHENAINGLDEETRLHYLYG